MSVHDPEKEISIDLLVPGMFIVQMDLPWYRTPFLFHKRLIKDDETIRLMKQHGIRTVTIDTSKGKDVSIPPSMPEESPENGDPSGDPAARQAPGEHIAPGAALQRPPHNSVHVLLREAEETVERIFADLEQGAPPSPAATRAVVSKVLSRVMHDRAGLLTQLAMQKLKQFDRSLAAHCLDTCILSLIVAVESELDDVTQDHLGVGALLHDVGYVRLPRNLVRRRGDCNDSERALLEQHPKLGLALLAEQPDIPEEVKRIVAEHHERDDGSGFPCRRTNGDISHLAKIVAIIDFYEDMVSRKGGRPAMLPHDAIRQLFLAGERGLFEKSLVETVIRSIGVYPVGSLVRLNTGEQAVVVGVNPGQRLKPLVKITGGPQGESYTNPVSLDLAAQSQERGARTVLRVLDPAQERVNIAMYLDEESSQAA